MLKNKNQRSIDPIIARKLWIKLKKPHYEKQIATEMMTETEDESIFIYSNVSSKSKKKFDAHAFAHYHSTVFIVQSAITLYQT